MELDSIDRDVLFELDRNSRQPAADLARGIQQSRERVNYRIARLEEAQVIRRYTTMVNPYKFGLVVYKTYVQLENNRQRVQKMAEVLKNHPRVYWYAEVAGTWDLMFAIFAKSPKEFYTLQGQILSRFSDIIVGFNVYTIVQAWFFRRRYFRGVGTDSYLFGGEPEDIRLSPLDFQLLRELSENARLTSVELAERLNTTANIVREHIRKLEQKGVITGYRTELDLGRLGIQCFKAQVHLRNYDPRAADEIRDFCRMTPHVVLMCEQLGDCKFEVELEVENYEQYSVFIDSMREKLAKYIRRVDSILYRSEHYKWMPFEIAQAEATNTPLPLAASG